MDGTERAIALDEETGEILWVTEWPTSYRMLMFSYAVGPRATPTVDDDRVYVVGAAGDLFCLSVETGEILWEKHYIADYGSYVPTFGVATSPIVDGDRLITAVGAEGGLVMAFDKRTGVEIWRSVDVVREMGYPQPIIIEAGGARQLIVWHAGALVSLDPVTGEVYWEVGDEHTAVGDRRPGVAGVERHPPLHLQRGGQLLDDAGLRPYADPVRPAPLGPVVGVRRQCHQQPAYCEHEGDECRLRRSVTVRSWVGEIVQVSVRYHVFNSRPSDESGVTLQILVWPHRPRLFVSPERTGAFARRT